ncbi:hypothetical protein B7463_g2230, partial [Scytalidium lignicola]
MDIIVPKRRIYLFQTLLHSIIALNSASAAGVFANQSVDWNDRTDLSFTTALLYEAQADRVRWLGIVEQRFPQLAGLGLGMQRWEELKNSAKPLSQKLVDFLGVPRGLYTRVLGLE